MQTILDNSRSPYAQLLASSSLLKLVTEHQLTCVDQSVTLNSSWSQHTVTSLAAAAAPLAAAGLAGVQQLLQLLHMFHDVASKLVKVPPSCRVWLIRSCYACCHMCCVCMYCSCRPQVKVEMKRYFLSYLDT